MIHPTSAGQRHPSLIKQRSILHLNLLGQEKGARLVVQPDRMKLNLVRRRWRKPRAPHYPHIASMQAKLRNVRGETYEIIDVRLSHNYLPAVLRPRSLVTRATRLYNARPQPNSIPFAQIVKFKPRHHTAFITASTAYTKTRNAR